MTARRMSADNKKFRDLVVIVQSDNFQDPVAPNYGERELRDLCAWFNFSLDERCFS